MASETSGAVPLVSNEAMEKGVFLDEKILDESIVVPAETGQVKAFVLLEADGNFRQRTWSGLWRARCGSFWTMSPGGLLWRTESLEPVASDERGCQGVATCEARVRRGQCGGGQVSRLVIGMVRL